VARTRVFRLLQGYRNQPPADINAVCEVLLRISDLASDLPEVLELDINPLLTDHQGVLALDARVKLGPARENRLAIRAYPDELEEVVSWQGEPLLLRPIRPEDGEAHVRFFQQLSSEDVRLRAFSALPELLPSQVARLTQIDYDREMAFIASRPTPGGGSETLGVVRAIADPDNQCAEFAIIVRSDIKGQGLGRLLMEKIIAYCRQRGTRELTGVALAHNRGLIRLARSLDFKVARSPDGDEMVELRLPLAGSDSNESQT
jgi:acetyltransferase